MAWKGTTARQASATRPQTSRSSSDSAMARATEVSAACRSAGPASGADGMSADCTPAGRSARTGQIRRFAAKLSIRSQPAPSRPFRRHPSGPDASAASCWASGPPTRRPPNWHAPWNACARHIALEGRDPSDSPESLRARRAPHGGGSPAAAQTPPNPPVLTLEHALALALQDSASVASAALQVRARGGRAGRVADAASPSFEVQAQASQLLTPISFTVPGGSLGTYPGDGAHPRGRHGHRDAPTSRRGA